MLFRSSQFLQTEGSFTIRKSVAELAVGTENSATPVDLLTIGAADIAAFVGVNGGQEHAMGLALGNVDLGIAVATSQTDNKQQWTALKATAGNIAAVGITGVTISATDLSVDISRAAANGQLVNFSATPLAIPGTAITLDYAAADGPVLQAAGTLDVDLFGFVRLAGSFAVQIGRAHV